MPNQYKRQVGSRNYRNYSDETLEQCLNEVKNKTMTQREAEHAYGVSRRTINYKLKNIHNLKVGRPEIFSNNEEKSFVDHIITMSNYGFPIDKCDLRYIVKSYLDRIGRKVSVFQNNLPGLSWTSSFLRRHKNLSIRLASNIKRTRASINKEILQDYITNLKETLAGVDPENIYNYDETNLTDNPGQKKVLVKRGSKYPERICNTSKVSISLMMCGNAKGEILPPYVVYKAKGLWEPWTENGPKNCRYNTSASGWFDANIFQDWFDKSLLRELKKKPGKKVVIGDNLSSHLSHHIINTCKKEDIYFVCLPPNSTHLTQPLDVAFFHPMKVAWRKILSEWKSSAEGLKNTTLQKQSFPSLLKKLLDVLQPTIKTTLQNGFKKCGIWPCDVNELLSRLPNSENNNSFVEETFIDHLSAKRSEIVQPLIKKRRKLNVAPGKSYAHIESENSSIEQSDEDEDVGSFIADTNDCPVSTSGKYSVNDFVIFNYMKTLYPGRITNTKADGATIQSMEKTKKFYRWPQKVDEIFYPWKDIMMKIKIPKLVRRGYFKVEELDVYTE